MMLPCRQLTNNHAYPKEERKIKKIQFDGKQTKKNSKAEPTEKKN